MTTQNIQEAPTTAQGRVYRVVAMRPTQNMDASTFVGAQPAFFDNPGNAIEISALQMKFKVEKSLKREPNPCEITISNCSEETRSFMTTNPLSVRLEAGHDNEARFLYQGDIRPGSYSKINGTTWETRLLLGEGARAFKDSRVNKAYAPGTSMLTILSDAAKSLGFKLPQNVVDDQSVGFSLPTGDVSVGYAADELTRLLAPYGYSWSIQDNKLIVLRDNEIRPGTVRVVDKDNGPLIGSPSYGQPGKASKKHGAKPPKLKFKCLLYPELVPGNIVQLNSRSITGQFKMVSVTHQGDTHSNDWTTEVEAKAI